MHNISHLAGRHYNDCRTLIQSLDWDGFYPVVDSDGILTGGVAEAQADLDICDIAVDGSVVIRQDAGDAMLARKMWVRYDFYLRDPHEGDEHRRQFEIVSQRPGAIAFDRSGPAEGDCDFEPSDQPSRNAVPVGMGCVWVPVGESR